MTQLPADPATENESGDDGDSTPGGDAASIFIDQFHHHGNDIRALADMADRHPDLARQLIDNKHDEAIISANSERLGMILATVFGIALIAGTSWTLVALGWWQSIMFVASLLGISHVLRTLLKGEFSDTAWFSKILTRAPKTPDTDSDQDRTTPKP